MSETTYNVIAPETGVPVKAWTKGVPLEDAARKQLLNAAQLPFIFKWIAAMPDVHWGIGATVGSVIPTKGAIIPAAVGVDIGCGMMAVRTSLAASDLPDNLGPLRTALEKAVPHGRTVGRGTRDKGAWNDLPAATTDAWSSLETGFRGIVEKHPKLEKANTANHLGTLGTGNHFLEVCLDQEDRVWLMLHSGSRGIGNRIGSYFIERAKAEMRRWMINLPDVDLAYLPQGSELFEDYLHAVAWAQQYARTNRELMMQATIDALRATKLLPELTAHLEAVNCHHNYVSFERHYDANVIVTRKGAVRARLGELGIIPGSMGAKSFIVRGKGNAESFTSCSHGAGRAMSRTKAKKLFTLADHAAATAGVECRKDAEVIDETPMAYKPIDQVMAAQADLVEIVHELRQVVCVKG